MNIYHNIELSGKHVHIPHCKLKFKVDVYHK